MKRLFPALLLGLCLSAPAAELTVTDAPGSDDFRLFDGTTIAPILVESNDDRAVIRAASDLAEDFSRVTGAKPDIEIAATPGGEISVIIGTLGKGGIIDQLAADGKLATNGVSGAVGKLYFAGREKSAARGGTRAGHRGQRPARDDFRHLPTCRK